MAMDRRAAAALIVAAPAAAFAVSGDSPKQAYFSATPLSSPFGELYTNQASRLWVELGETEKGIYTRVARETSVKLAEVSTPCSPTVVVILCEMEPRFLAAPASSNLDMETGRRLHSEERVGPLQDCPAWLHV